MKKIRSIICSLIMVILVILVMPSFNSVKAASLKDAPIITFNQEINGKTAVITANLKQNTGICGMKLEINYDKDNLSLDAVAFGTALRSLKPIQTGSAVENDKIVLNWESDLETVQNDASTGILLVMRFTLKDSISNGTYKVGFKYERNHDIVYLDTDGELKYKSLISDAANIIVDNEDIQQIEVVEKDINDDDEGNLGTAALAGIIAGGVFVLASAIFLIIFLIKRKDKSDKANKNDWDKI